MMVAPTMSKVAMLDLSTSLNTPMLSSFLAGLYTLTYLYSLYAYLARQPKRGQGMAATLTALYLVYLWNFIVRWFYLNWQFVQNTNHTLFSPNWPTPYPQLFLILSLTSYSTLSLIADGLLIWRCFYAWDRSVLVITVPVCFWVLEIVLLTIFGSRGTLTPHESLILLAVTAASSFVVCLTSLTASALIAHRVIYVVKASTRPTRGLMHVVDIVVQSSALYSVVYLAYSISLVVEAATLSNGDATSILAATVASYLESLVSAVAGLAPTIMVIRVNLAPSTRCRDESSFGNQSSLQFLTKPEEQCQDEIPSSQDMSVASGTAELNS
ncbi:hypothetical protein CVT26_006869 [Gymnopilus dilepis]|uniref:THH1/TOM1/TOM3 domain-containing protein n=1 Tax=Gymnopilus dilepis TaxID=231916 RepID=A0A409W0T1_9AGAR|nr:hypothetical protein CVT26_006869 [Gymnopilus dilepis]